MLAGRTMAANRSVFFALAAHLAVAGCEPARLPPEPSGQTPRASLSTGAPAASPAASAAQGEATCAKLPAGYAYRPSVGAHAREDHLTLVPPFTVRTERRAAGGGGRSCTPIPEPVQRLVDTLNGIYRY